MTKRTVRVGALLLATTLLAAACGEDDVSSGGGATTTTGADSTTTTAADDSGDASSTTAEAGDDQAGDEQAAADFCEAVPEVDAVLNGEPDPAAVDAALTRVEESAPPELQAPVMLLSSTIRSLAETGDFAAMLQAEVAAANVAVNEYLIAECGFTEVSITGRDYEYDGVPETLSTGPIALQLANEGNEYHEAVVFRINDDVTESIEELLQLPEEEAQTKAQSMGGTFAAPGSQSATSIQLEEPGRYAIVCFLPVGATEEAFQEMLASGTEPQGPPHFTQGMVAEFTVE